MTGHILESEVYTTLILNTPQGLGKMPFLSSRTRSPQLSLEPCQRVRAERTGRSKESVALPRSDTTRRSAWMEAGPQTALEQNPPRNFG
jgi:hypothetical protein